jgi:hypothetical protein
VDFLIGLGHRFVRRRFAGSSIGEHRSLEIFLPV